MTTLSRGAYGWPSLGSRSFVAPCSHIRAKNDPSRGRKWWNVAHSHPKAVPKLPWSFLQVNPKPAWNHAAVFWESLGNHLGVIWELFGRHLGDTWESSGRHLGVIWEPSRGHRQVVPKPCWEVGGWMMIDVGYQDDLAWWGVWVLWWCVLGNSWFCDDFEWFLPMSLDCCKRGEFVNFSLFFIFFLLEWNIIRNFAISKC